MWSLYNKCPKSLEQEIFVCRTDFICEGFGGVLGTLMEGDDLSGDGYGIGMLYTEKV